MVKDPQIVADYSRVREKILAEVAQKKEQRRLRRDRRPIVWFVTFLKVPRHRKKLKGADGVSTEVIEEENISVGLGYMHIGGKSGTGNCHLKLATFENLERMHKYIVAYDLPDIDEAFNSVKNKDTVTGFAVSAIADKKKEFATLMQFLEAKIKELEGQFNVAERESNLELRIKELEAREAKLLGATKDKEPEEVKPKANKKAEVSKQKFDDLKKELNGG